MKLFTPEIIQQLRANGEACHPIGGHFHSGDVLPVLKLSTPDNKCTWLLSEASPHYPEIFHGLCDLGTGIPQFGEVAIPEIYSLLGMLAAPMTVERDLNFNPTKTIAEYTEEARKHGRIMA